MVIQYESLQSIIINKGYDFFEGEKNINLVGVRTENVATNHFDDHLLVAMEFGGAKQVILFNEFTTDPGNYYLKNELLNPDGCAILKPGQYKGMWIFGDHKGKYPALVQKGVCIVGRDRDKDGKLNPSTEQSGVFGINMHHAFDAEEINKYSAGCQVHQYDEQLNVVLALCKLSSILHGDSFSYTLLEAKDF